MPRHGRRSRAGRPFVGYVAPKAAALPCDPRPDVHDQSPSHMLSICSDSCTGESERGAVLRLREVLLCQTSFAWSLSLAHQLVERTDVELRATLSKTYSQARDAFHKVANLTMVYSKVLIDIQGRVLPDLFTAIQEEDLLTSLRISRLLLAAAAKMRKDGDRVHDDILVVRQIIGNVILCGELSLEFGLLPNENEVADSTQNKKVNGADSRPASPHLLKLAICQLEVAQNVLQESRGVQWHLQSTLRLLTQKERVLEQLVSKLEPAVLTNDLTSPPLGEDIQELTAVCKSLADQYWLGATVEEAKCIDLFGNICGAMDDISTLTQGTHP